MTDQPDPYVREAGGRFGRGNPGGPGRKRVRPLRDVVTWEAERELWEQHKALAQQDTEEGARAREFCLRHANGNPLPAAPDIAGLDWPTVRTVADLGVALDVVLTAHREDRIDATALGWLVDLLGKMVRVLESVELVPQVRALQEQLATIKAQQTAP